MDPISRAAFMGAAGATGETFDTSTAIGAAANGGYFAGYISHTADGTATHALIVAPVATGATGSPYSNTTQKQWQTTTSTTSATSSYDGAANTALMTNSPAADFCTGLSIGGYSDWYLPAPLEFDIAYYNLKPTSGSNNTSFGTNSYSVPQRTSNYTSSDPGQTSVSAFQSGGSEAFQNEDHWTSVEVNSTVATRFFMTNGSYGNGGKTDGNRVRAFRKVAL